MLALRWHGIRDVRVEEREKPVPGPGEALIHVAYAGICGSDLHIYTKGMFIQNIPEIMGHECCGIVEACGEGVQDILPGDHVVPNPMVPCGTCESCKNGSWNTCEALGFIGEVCPGCFAEYVCLPAKRLIRADPAADMRILALTEPLAVAVNVCRRASFSPTDTLAVIGAGPVGLLVAAAARQVYHLENVTIVNRSPGRREIAEKLGLEALASLPEGRRFSHIVDAAGSSASLSTALEHIRARGCVLAVSVYESLCTLDANLLVGAECTLTGCNCYTTEDLQTAAQLLSSGKLQADPVITDVLPLTEGPAAFEKLCGKDKTSAKILFQIGG